MAKKHLNHFRLWFIYIPDIEWLYVMVLQSFQTSESTFSGAIPLLTYRGN